jgi:hypothetical protein
VDKPLLGGLRGVEELLAALLYDGFISDADALQ